MPSLGKQRCFMILKARASSCPATSLGAWHDSQVVLWPTLMQEEGGRRRADSGEQREKVAAPGSSLCREDVGSHTCGNGWLCFLPACAAQVARSLDSNEVR
eukprot:254326-Chlamydomonas_euryale.AAC.1